MGLLGATSGAVLLGVAVVLVLASVASWWVSRRLGDRQPELVRNLVQRVWAWWVMVGVLAVALALGEAATLVLFLGLSWLSLREFLTIAPTGRADHRTLVWLVYVVTPVHYWLVWNHWYGMFVVFLPVYAFLFLPLRSALGGRTTDFLQRAAVVQWALMVCVFAVSHIPAILRLPVGIEVGRGALEGSEPGAGGEAGALLLLFLLLVVQGSDVFQYVWGKTLGRHPVAPGVSPNKTWEGLVGGVLTATLLGAALSFMTPFGVLGAALVSFVCCLLGFGGGLVMSAIKRDRGIKDFGALLPGHGGIMDRLDSLVFAAPVFFHLVRYTCT